MRVRQHFGIQEPLPPGLPRHVVVSALQTFSPVIRHLGTLARYESIPLEPSAIENDPFFANASVNSPNDSPGSADLNAVSSFKVYEIIALVPGLKKEVNYPTHFQAVADGLRCRADGSAGIVGWCQFTVRAKPKPQSTGSASTGSPSYAGSTPGSLYAPEPPDEYELFEEAMIEANSLLMPFVVQTMQVAHQDLCKKVLNEVLEKYVQGYDYTRQ